MLLSHQNGKLPQDFHAQTLRPCEIVCRQQLEQRRRSFSPWIINWIKISLERVWKKKKRKKEKKLLLYFCLSGCVNTCICSWCVIMLQCKIQSDFMGNDGQIARVIKMQMLFFFFFLFFFTCFHTLLVHIVRTTTGQKWELRRIYRHKCPDCIAVLAVGTLPLALIIKSDPRWAPSAEVASQNEVQSEGSGGGVYFSGPNNERLWSKPVPDQRFSEPSVTLFRL